MGNIDIDGIFNAIDSFLPGLGLQEMEEIGEQHKEWAEHKAKELLAKGKDLLLEDVLSALTEAFGKGANSAADILQNAKLESGKE